MGALDGFNLTTTTTATPTAPTSSDEDAADEDDEGEEGASSALVGFLNRGEHVPRVKDGTPRLAVCNCDWDQMGAADLLAVLRSFVPAGGRIESVTVYPSDFGEKRMAEEATVGPTALMNKRAQKAAAEDAEDDDDDGGDDDDDESDGGGEEEEEDEMVVNENLRRYELDRLRYYYAVVVCDGVATAERIYAECDGAEFESSSLPLDLRFIPDEMSFQHKTPRDACRELPPKYAAPTFMCSALQQSKPTLSWDKDDSTRTATMRRDLSKAEVREMEYSSYLASGSDGSDDDDEGEEDYVFQGPRPPKRSETGGGLRELLKVVRSGGGGAAEEVDKEMTFELSGDEGGDERGKGGEAAPRSVFEVEEEKRRQKRKAKREEMRRQQGGGGGAAEEDEEEGGGGDDDDDLYADDDGPLPSEFADDPFFAEAMAERDAEDEAAAAARGGGERAPKPKKAKGGAAAAGADAAGAGGGKKDRKKGKKGKRAPALTPEEAAEAARQEAELELVMLGDDAAEATAQRRGYDINALEIKGGGRRSDGKGGAKGKRKRLAEEAAAAAAAGGGAGDDGFALDVGDSRFASIYSSSDFAIDPTHPKFRRTAAAEQLLEETQRRHAEPRRDDERAAAEAATSSAAPGDAALSRLVSSVKAKSSKLGKSPRGAKK